MPAQRFASDWGKVVPATGPDATPIGCPNCGGRAEMDRTGARVWGWDDRCGWTDSMRVVRVAGREILEPDPR